MLPPRLRAIIFGAPPHAKNAVDGELPKWRALAAFSPDGLSSIAYANQEIFLGLAVAGAAGLLLSWKIALAIAVLLVLVGLSYYQTIHGYPSGGGSYIVAKQNLGNMAGLVAGSALLVGYILTAAVSLTAGVDAIASVFPVLWDYRVLIALIILALITLINLRGMNEMSTWISIPVYFFLFTYLPMLAIGVLRLIIEGPTPWTETTLTAVQPVGTFLVLHTFASGCTALTGIEAISNGVPAFRSPKARNAGITLLVLAALMVLLFLGSVFLIQAFGALPDGQETILSALAGRIYGKNLAYFIVQLSTLLILAVAANTSYAGFPRLAAILAQDGYLPRSMASLGEQLVFRNGIALLALATGLLIVIFRGDSHALIPLFALGVFLAFTLSQSGMVRHWWRERGPGWRWKMLMNLVGAVATAIALLIIGYSKFLEGAWIVIVLLAVLVIFFMRIKDHYVSVGKQLTLRGLPPSLRPYPPLRVVIPVSGVHRGVIEAVNLARSISNDISAAYVELDPQRTAAIRKDWLTWFPDIPLDVIPSPHRKIISPLLSYLDELDARHHDGQLAAIVLPEFIPARWWHSILHNQTAWMLKAALLYRRRHLGFQRVIIDVPFHLRR